MNNLENFYNSREEVLNFLKDYTKTVFDAGYEAKHGKRLKILTPRQMLQRLPIALAWVKAVNNWENLLNEIRKFVCINQKKSLKKYAIT